MAPTWKSSSGEAPTGEATTHANEAAITAATRMSAATSVRRCTADVGMRCPTSGTVESRTGGGADCLYMDGSGASPRELVSARNRSSAKGLATSRVVQQLRQG